MRSADESIEGEYVMAHKKKHKTRIPIGNQPKLGPEATTADQKAISSEGASFEEQDPKRRLGGYEGKGEHARQQPSDLNDGTHHSK